MDDDLNYLYSAYALGVGRTSSVHLYFHFSTSSSEIHISKAWLVAG